MSHNWSCGHAKSPVSHCRCTCGGGGHGGDSTRSVAPTRGYAPSPSAAATKQDDEGSVMPVPATAELSPAEERKVAEMLIPILVKVATVALPQFAPLITIAYTYYQNKEKIEEIAQKISDDDLEGAAKIIVAEAGKKAVGVVAEAAGEELAGISSDALKNAGVFNQVGHTTESAIGKLTGTSAGELKTRGVSDQIAEDAERYYRDFVKDEVEELVEKYADEFVDKL